MEPYVFIVGCARSGTTLLERMMNAHPMMAIAPEIHWITDAFPSRDWNSSRCLVTTEMLESLVQHNMFRRLNVSREDFIRPVSPGNPIKGAKFLIRFFSLYRLVRGRILVGSKTPSYVQRIPDIHALWPETRFIHIIRDGRDVCLSVLDWKHADRTAGRYDTWAQDPISTAALWWKRKVDLGQQGGKPLGPELYFEVRYEDMVADPVGTCTAVCAFLRVPYDEAMVRFHEGPEPARLRDHPWRPVTAGLRDWRSQMPADACLRFEAAAGDVLARVGYPRSCPVLPPDAEQHAKRMCQLFNAGAAAKGERPPEPE
jgi:hypothetical protein